MTTITVTSAQGNAALISRDDWQSLEETSFLSSIPGMRTSIINGMKEPIASCVKSIDLVHLSTRFTR